jgi:hypothetical protein
MAAVWVALEGGFRKYDYLNRSRSGATFMAETFVGIKKGPPK